MGKVVGAVKLTTYSHLAQTLSIRWLYTSTPPYVLIKHRDKWLLEGLRDSQSREYGRTKNDSAGEDQQQFTRPTGTNLPLKDNSPLKFLSPFHLF
jgi:hypothetical protein